MEFPALRQSPAASAVTFGLDSYMIPITPKGTLINPTSMPFGLLCIEIISFIGSGCAATSLNPSEILWIFSVFNTNLSTLACSKLFFFAFSKSFLFASTILSACFSNSSAILNKALFFDVVEAFFNLNAASRAFSPIIFISSSIIIKLHYLC